MNGISDIWKNGVSDSSGLDIGRIRDNFLYADYCVFVRAVCYVLIFLL